MNTLKSAMLGWSRVVVKGMNEENQGKRCWSSEWMSIWSDETEWCDAILLSMIHLWIQFECFSMVNVVNTGISLISQS